MSKDQSTTKNVSSPCENPNCTLSNDPHNCFLMRIIPLISFRDPTIYKTRIQWLLCHFTTLLIGSCWPCSILKRQFINIKQTHSQYFFYYFRWIFLQYINGTRLCPSILHDALNGVLKLDSLYLYIAKPTVSCKSLLHTALIRDIH